MSVHMWQLWVRFQYPQYVCQQHGLFVHLIHLDALQVAAQALNGSEAEACIQDAPTEALTQWLWDLECEHAPKLYHTAERFFSCTGGAMHPLLEPWMPRSKPGRSQCFVAVHQLHTSSKHDCLPTL